MRKLPDELKTRIAMRSIYDKTCYRQGIEDAHAYYDKKIHDWIDIEDFGAVQEMIEPNGEGNGCSKPFLGQNDKGETFIIYAICENDEGTWTDNIFGAATRENTWYEDIVKVKKINY